ncbi:hypothetical protein GF345_06555 [Candidatus Woesearchaeota archaeon]|nr:hypothetical protein [Candidatus Woesearchaeota archaeon]
MRKRNAFAIIFTVVMIISMIQIAAAYQSSTTLAMNEDNGVPNLQPVMLRYEPFPVNPGEYMDVWIKFQNEESGTIDDLTIEFVPEYPFSLDASDTATRHFGEIGPHSSVLVKYRVRVDEDAVEGERYFRYRYRYVQSDMKWEEAIEKITVQTREAVLNIDSVDTEPDSIVPGQEAKVSLKIRNSATSVIRDIGFYLDLTMSSVASSTATSLDTYYNAIPLAPVSSSTEKRITHLKPGEEATLEYDLIAFPEAESGIYKVPVIIKYMDELGKNYTKYDIIGLSISDDPDIYLVVEQNNIYSEGAAADVSIKIVNKGVTNVKFMDMTLRESDDYDVVSPANVYVGDVDSDDYETAEFSIYVKDLEDNKLKLPVRIDYKDANNKDYARDLVLEITAYGPDKRGEQGTSKLGIVIVLLVLMVAGWFIYRRWEKKKNADKSKDAGKSKGK